MVKKGESIEVKGVRYVPERHHIEETTELIGHLLHAAQCPNFKEMMITKAEPNTPDHCEKCLEIKKVIGFAASTKKLQGKGSSIGRI